MPWKLPEGCALLQSFEDSGEAPGEAGIGRLEPREIFVFQYQPFIECTLKRSSVDKVGHISLVPAERKTTMVPFIFCIAACQRYWRRASRTSVCFGVCRM